MRGFLTITANGTQIVAVAKKSARFRSDHNKYKTKN